MHITDERYNDIKDKRKEIERDCDEVETIAEFSEKYGDKYFIESEGEDSLTIDDDGDIYTVEDNGYGLEVSATVKVMNPVLRAYEDLQVGLWEEC